MQRILLETTFSEKYQQEPIFKCVLKAEFKDDGSIFSYLYNEIDDNGTGWKTKTFFDLEKALIYFLKMVKSNRKSTFNWKNIKITPSPEFFLFSKNPFLDKF